MSDPTGRAEGGPRFTPGPWKVDGRPGTIYEHDIVGPNGEDIAYANASDGADEPTFYPAVENAQLMAAAPDLYAALHKLAYEQPTVEAIEQARAALARADGR